MQEIDRRVSVAGEIYEAKSLADLVQRQVTQSGQKIAEYLNAQPQRFFNSLVLGAYGGAPRWFELSIDPKQWQDAELPNDLEGSVGILALNGEERLFPIDGQRRVVGIRSALKSNPRLGNEEVAVLLVGHKLESLEGRTSESSAFPACSTVSFNKRCYRCWD
jgi:DNA sulfur modification protein DndB